MFYNIHCCDFSFYGGIAWLYNSDTADKIFDISIVSDASSIVTSGFSRVEYSHHHRVTIVICCCDVG
jgi:hypothetical protein